MANSENADVDPQQLTGPFHGTGRGWRVESQVDVLDGLTNPNITSIARNRFQVKVQRTEFQAQVWRDDDQFQRVRG